MIFASKTNALSLVAFGLAIATPPLASAAPDSPDTWWRDTVFYEIFVRSFADSTTGPLAGDGVGDLRGIIENLDYLNDADPATKGDLGITALWLMPIAESPSYHGYDVVDYTSVDSEYGTAEDFRDLVDACHERGIRVIVDTVINHASAEHPWFQQSIDKDSPKHDWFVWTDTPPAGPGAPQHSVWHDKYRDRNGQYFYGFFWSGMPDFNLRNPDATNAVYDFSRFWLKDMNADGLRLDAIKHLIEDGVIFENTPETLDWLRNYNAAMHEAKPDAFIVGEVWADTPTIARFMDGGVDSAFAFPLASAIVDSLNNANAKTFRRTIKGMVKTDLFPRFSTFIGNHDMDRVINRLGGSQQRAAAAATILLTLPGVPFIYYGEEIGMQGTKPDPDLRTPMQWTPEPETAGFTTGKPWHKPNADTPTVNVESQKTDEDSLLNLYRDLIRLRTSHPALSTGDFELIFGGHDAVVAWVRETENQRLLVIVNLSSSPVADYRISGAKGMPVRELLHNRGVTTKIGYPILELKPYTGYVIELMDTPR
jgi:alpha-amylase